MDLKSRDWQREHASQPLALWTLYLKLPGTSIPPARTWPGAWNGSDGRVRRLPATKAMISRLLWGRNHKIHAKVTWSYWAIYDVVNLPSPQEYKSTSDALSRASLLDIHAPARWWITYGRKALGSCHVLIPLACATQLLCTGICGIRMQRLCILAVCRARNRKYNSGREHMNVTVLHTVDLADFYLQLLAIALRLSLLARGHSSWPFSA